VVDTHIQSSYSIRMTRNTFRKWLLFIFGNIVIVALLMLISQPLRTILYVVLGISDVFTVLGFLGYSPRRRRRRR